MNYASPWKRLLAFLIDVIAMLGIYMVLGMILSLSLFFPVIRALPMIGFWLYGSLFFVSWIYFAVFESSSWQATIGKHVLGLKVTDLTGQRISFWRATARYFLKFLSRLILYIGVLMAFFTKRKQALHDKFSSTLILDQKSRD